MITLDAMTIGVAVVAVVVIVAIAAFAYLRRPKKAEEDDGKKITEDHIIAKMDTILRYQNVDRP